MNMIPAIATLDHAMDVLSLREPAFHAECVLPAMANVPLLVMPTRVLAQRGDALKAALGAFIVPVAGHYLFMATVDAGIRLLLHKNGLMNAEPLEKTPTLLLAGLMLVAGDVVTLAAVAADARVSAGAVVRWRGART